MPTTNLPPFAHRHIGSDSQEATAMLGTLKVASLETLLAETVPAAIRLAKPMQLPEAVTEAAALKELAGLAAENTLVKNFLGLGYHGTITPPVIQRNILENPGWYTAYTPYQAEISQGRMEALVNFQTMVTDLTALDVANASLLDEGTAAAEAMAMAFNASKNLAKRTLCISSQCHPQTISVITTRAGAMGWTVEKFSTTPSESALAAAFAVMVSYPDTVGNISDFAPLAETAHAAGALVIAIADPLALSILKPPGEWGADIAVGSTQRFGVPMGFGGPHAAYLACRDALKRQLPGRLVGISKDVHGNPAYRLSLQTREQHIRRDKATSNICTAQVLLAVMAGVYAQWHGPQGLRDIAENIRSLAATLQQSLESAGLNVAGGHRFDTVAVTFPQPAARQAAQDRASAAGLNLRSIGLDQLLVTFDETHDLADAAAVATALTGRDTRFFAASEAPELGSVARESAFLTHPVFHRYRSEHEMLRYLRSLEAKDFSLCHGMIPLGSCTMKLNASSEMLPVTWPAFSQAHPYAPASQNAGYLKMLSQLESWLAEITGFAGVSLEPNAGSQGEFAGLLVIRRWHESKGQGHRNICLIPTSAHGTNPASAVMAGMKVVPVACREDGDIDLADLRRLVGLHGPQLAALMITYPSTHGVFEDSVVEICTAIHAAGGQVYMDGANMNAQVGLTSPGHIGADVCHLNLHKTFCIPHGGGGPGVGPVCVAAHLVPFLPRRGAVEDSISAAPYGSASIAVVPWMFIRMMGSAGLTAATSHAILHANYIAARLAAYFPVLYQGQQGRVAHECILDLRGFKKSTAEDVAKRLMDYGFHAPTLSWPVAGTLMVEPTESEGQAELDRFCDAMISIHGEMTAVENGSLDATNNPLKNAPHTAASVICGEWSKPYSREMAAYPSGRLTDRKFWPSVGRVDNVWGDRNLFCSCLPQS